MRVVFTVILLTVVGLGKNLIIPKKHQVVQAVVTEFQNTSTTTIRWSREPFSGTNYGKQLLPYASIIGLGGITVYFKSPKRYDITIEIN